MDRSAPREDITDSDDMNSLSYGAKHAVDPARYDITPTDVPEGIAMAGQEQQGGSKRPSRRAVLRSAAGAGAAGVAATALSGLGATAAAAEGRTDQHDRAADARAASTAESSEQVVVHVRDARSGQIDVFRGTGQVRLHDRDLARLLDRLSRG